MIRETFQHNLCKVVCQMLLLRDHVMISGNETFSYYKLHSFIMTNLLNIHLCTYMYFVFRWRQKAMVRKRSRRFLSPPTPQGKRSQYQFFSTCISSLP